MRGGLAGAIGALVASPADEALVALATGAALPPETLPLAALLGGAAGLIGVWVHFDRRR